MPARVNIASVTHMPPLVAVTPPCAMTTNTRDRQQICMARHGHLAPRHAGIRIRARVNHGAGNFLEAGSVRNARGALHNPESQCIAAPVRLQCTECWDKQRCAAGSALDIGASKSVEQPL